VAVTNHGYLGYAVIVNRKFWNSLPADIRVTLEKALSTQPAKTTTKPKN